MDKVDWYFLIYNIAVSRMYYASKIYPSICLSTANEQLKEPDKQITEITNTLTLVH